MTGYDQGRGEVVSKYRHTSIILILYGCYVQNTLTDLRDVVKRKKMIQRCPDQNQREEMKKGGQYRNIVAMILKVNFELYAFLCQ